MSFEISSLAEIIEDAEHGHFRVIRIFAGDNPHVEYTQRVPLCGIRRDDISEGAVLRLFSELQNVFVAANDQRVNLEIGNRNAIRSGIVGRLIEGHVVGAQQIAAEQLFDNYGVEGWHLYPGFRTVADLDAYMRRRGELAEQWYDVVKADGPRNERARQSLLSTLSNEIDLTDFNLRLFVKSLGLDV